MPNTRNMSLKRLKSHEKHQDYHAMLDVILAPLAEIQKTKIFWKLQYKGKEYLVNLHLPVMYFMGDSEGHDKLAGRKMAYHNTSHLCRYCDIPFDETDNPDYAYNYRQQSDIQHMLEYNQQNSLDEIGFYNIKKMQLTNCNFWMQKGEYMVHYLQNYCILGNMVCISMQCTVCFS